MDPLRLEARKRVGERPALVAVEPVLVQVALPALRVGALEKSVARRLQQHGPQNVPVF